MRAVPVFWGVATVVIALFLLQIAKRVTASHTNPVSQTVADGLTFILNG
jgi:hypothetical protein